MSHRNSRFRPLLLSVLLLCSLSVAAQDATALLAQRASSIAQEEISKQGIAGLAISIAIDNKIAVSDAYGFADLENRIPATKSTLFRTGSIAKPITAVGAMALVQQGKLDLDAPVQNYCPAFPRKQWTVTTRQLLGHLAGVHHYKRDGSDFLSTKHYAKLTDAFEQFAEDPLEFEPGSKFLYTTYGYNVIGCVIEGASGKDFATTLNELVLRPAAMNSTRTDEVSEIVPARSRPYTHAADRSLRNAPFVDTSNKIPGGGIISTAEDLARLAISLHTNALLKATTAKLMWTSQTTKDGKATGYGCGWNVSEADGVQTIMHGGSQPGASSVLVMLPQKGFAVAVMANTDEVNVRRIAQALTSVYLESTKLVLSTGSAR